MDNEYNYNPEEFVNTTNEYVEPEPEMQVSESETQECEIVEEVETTNMYEYISDTPPSNSEEPVQSDDKNIKKGNGKKWLLCVSMAVVFGLIASAVFCTSNYFYQRYGNKQSGETEQQKVGSTNLQVTTNSSTETKKELTNVSQVAANVMPSVVAITNLSVQEVNYFFFGGSTTQEIESSGSGIIIGQNEKELLIVSNNHVVAGSNTLTVSFVDGTSVEAQIKGVDSDMDLAIISVPTTSVEKSTMEIIKVAVLGNSDELVVGEQTIAIGNALGYGQSVTTGIVSALERELDGMDTKFIQTDAAINPGNSGGALLNSNGEVIGINTAKVYANAVESMGYAIPISDVQEILDELMNRETRTKVPESERGVLGISGVTVDEMTSQVYGIPQGVHVSEVLDGGGAEKAGIPKGCVIVKVEKTKVKTMEELVEQLEYYRAGEEISITVKIPSDAGTYKEKTYEVKLSKKSIWD